jgi:hypothetical protein
VTSPSTGYPHAVTGATPTYGRRDLRSAGNLIPFPVLPEEEAAK